MTLLVINQLDLLAFGCPSCGCVEGGTFLSFDTWSLWGCESCASECAVVEESVNEMSKIQIRDTDIRDLIGHHPYDGHREFDLPWLSAHSFKVYELELTWERLRN